MPDEAYASTNPTSDAMGADALARYAKAIAHVESRGKYDLLGPLVRGGDRAYGKYQVMGANVPAWTREAIGRFK